MISDKWTKLIAKSTSNNDDQIDYKPNSKTAKSK